MKQFLCTLLAAVLCMTSYPMDPGPTGLQNLLTNLGEAELLDYLGITQEKLATLKEPLPTMLRGNIPALVRLGRTEQEIREVIQEAKNKLDLNEDDDGVHEAAAVLMYAEARGKAGQQSLIVRYRKASSNAGTLSGVQLDFGSDSDEKGQE